MGNVFPAQIVSTVPMGTAPLVIASTTLCVNLNADLLDGLHAASFAGAAHTHTSGDITDFQEAVEDRVGAAVVGGHSITSGYVDGTGLTTLTLVNDAAAPGANKVYGTDGAGAKGWKNDPGGGGGVSDGDKGDITVSGGGVTWTIDPDVVTHAKYQDIATDRLLGRDTAASGDPEELTVGNGLAFTGAGGIGIANDGVTYARIQDCSATQRVLGRNTAGAGDFEECTVTQVLDWVGNTRGSILYRGAGGWAILAPGTAGFVLTSNGAGADPSYQAALAFTKAAATTVAAANDLTWLTLAANSADITGTGLTTVLSITGVGVGRYYFKCQLIYQTTNAGTGIDVAANHSGTTTQWLCEGRFASTGAAAATAAAAENSAAATGNLYEAQGNRTKNAIIGAGTVSVDTANTDMMYTIEGFFVVSVTGTLEIKLAAESAGLVCRAMQGSHLELRKLS